MKNNVRFFTGITMLAVPIVNTMLYGLTKLNYDWITWKVAGGIFGLIWLVTAIALIWSGSKKDESE